jgi:hypothetical protein
MTSISERISVELVPLGEVPCCEQGPAYAVTVVDPLVSRVGPLRVCAACMVGLWGALDDFVDQNPRLVVSVAVWA